MHGEVLVIWTQGKEVRNVLGTQEWGWHRARFFSPFFPPPAFPQQRPAPMLTASHPQQCRPLCSSTTALHESTHLPLEEGPQCRVETEAQGRPKIQGLCLHPTLESL